MVIPPLSGGFQTSWLSKSHSKMYRFFPSPNKWENTFWYSNVAIKTPWTGGLYLGKNLYQWLSMGHFPATFDKGYCNPNVTWPLDPRLITVGIGLWTGEASRWHGRSSWWQSHQCLGRQRQHMLQMESYHWSPQELKKGYSNDNSVVSLHLGSNCFRSWKSTNTL